MSVSVFRSLHLLSCCDVNLGLIGAFSPPAVKRVKAAAFQLGPTPVLQLVDRDTVFLLV